MKKHIGLLLTALLPFAMQAQLVMTSNYDVVMSSGTQTKPTSLVLTNSTTQGIVRTGTGWIISENEFNQVDWNINSSTGTFVVPFGYSTTDYLPVTFDVSTAGSSNGMVKFSTYHGATWDNSTYQPSDVTNMTDYGATNYSNNMVDRFWDIDANTGYTTKPTANLTFTYVHSGASNEIASPNYIVEKDLVAQRFNSSSDQWSDFTGTTNTDATSGSTGTVSSGSLAPADLFRSWTLSVDSALVALGVQEISSIPAEVTVWPNPAATSIRIKLNQVQEGDATISIINVMGQELATKNQHITQGMIIPMDISNLSADIYFVKISSQGFTSTTKFVKQ